MAIRIFFVLTGFGLAVSGGVSTIAYLNLLTTGYELQEFLAFVGSRLECYLLPIGMIIIWISIYYPIDTKYKDQ